MKDLQVTVKKEKELLQQAKRFNLNALGEIYDLYSPELYRYAVRLLNNPDLAEECVAETFSRFLKALSNHGGPQKYLRAYLYRIAHNWVTDFYRKQPLIQTDHDFEHLVDPSPAITELVDDHLKKEKVRKAINYLTPDQRQVIVLKFLQGWPNAEIAEAIHKPIGAVKSLQHRGLTSLRRMLSEDGE